MKAVPDDAGENFAALIDEKMALEILPEKIATMTRRISEAALDWSVTDNEDEKAALGRGIVEMVGYKNKYVERLAAITKAVRGE